jgi:hypothetical protein
MSGVNWGLIGSGPDAGTAFSQGMEQGREHRRQTQANNALAAYAQNPDDPNAAHSLLAVDPRLGMQVMQEQRERQQHSELQQIRQRAASGDHDAITELFARDPESWTRLDAPHREQIKQATSFMGNAVMAISRLPEQQRAQAWAQYVQHAEASGMDIPAHYEHYSPEAMNSAAAEAGMMEKVIKQFEPDYRAIVPGGELRNVNPLANGASMGQALPVGPAGGIPQPAIQRLQQNPHEKAQFDEIFGAGAADRVLGGAGSQAPRPFPQ